jgi:FolB domain-containing protein
MIAIYIKDLVVEAKHGWHPHEKTKDQRFKISVELQTETKSTKTDELDDTLNWSALRDQIVAVIKNNSFNLVEKLAQAIAEDLLTNGSVEKVTVSVDKLDAFANGVPGVRLELSR